MRRRYSHRIVGWILSVVFLPMLFPSQLHAQQHESIGKICLNPFVPEEQAIGTVGTKVLMSKLGQAATAAGMSGQGFDNRFVIVAHVQDIQNETTATYPTKTALKVAVTIFVGDGIDGTLFSSYTKEVKGVGNNKSDAYASAFKKLQPRNSELLNAIETGKQRIVQYYDQISSNVIKTAEADAKAGHYEEAISALFSIPMACKDYDAAQELIARYGAVALENSNMKMIADARSAWSSAPNEEGASKAMDIMNQLQAPSKKVLAEAKKLSDEIAARLKRINDREWQLTVQQTQNEHKEQMAQIESEKQQNIASVRAAASVARAYYNSRPRVVYHVHWW